MPIDGPDLVRWIDPRVVIDVDTTLGDSAALVDLSKPPTLRRELEQHSHWLAASYRRVGLRAGDRLASVVANRSELVAHYLACLRAGIIVVPLSFRLGRASIENALRLSNARGVVVDDTTVEKVRQCDLGPGCDLGLMPIEPRPDTYPGEVREAAGGGSGPGRHSNALLLFTSGSSGPAKGVTHTVGTLGYRVSATAQGLELTKDDVYLSTSSLADGMTINVVLASLAVGGRVALPPDGKRADELLDLMRSVRPTVMGLVPSTLDALLNHPNFDAEACSSLRLVRCSGDALPQRLDERFLQVAGFPVSRGYGITEIGPVALNRDLPAGRSGSVGGLGPGISLLISAADGREMPRGSTGAIWIRSPSCTTGYFGHPEQTARVMKDGWFDTGDVGFVDPDGYLWLTGRRSAIIIRDGRNIHPSEVEDVMARHPAVTGVAVVGVPSATRGEDVRAFVTVDPAARPTAQELLNWVEARLGVAAPTEIIELRCLPLMPNGKVDRFALRAGSFDLAPS